MRNALWRKNLKGVVMSTRKSCVLLATIIAASLFTSVAAQAQPWVGTGGAAVVAEESAGIYDASVGSHAYLSGSTSTNDIKAFFNVTDTSGTGNPSWNTLELASYDNSPNTYVRAQLMRITPGGTYSVVICTSTDLVTKKQCTFPAGSVDFNSGDGYIMQITLSRTSASYYPYPRFYYVRLF
jgi:hypothetical protein